MGEANISRLHDSWIFEPLRTLIHGFEYTKVCSKHIRNVGTFRNRIFTNPKFRKRDFFNVGKGRHREMMEIGLTNSWKSWIWDHYLPESMKWTIASFETFVTKKPRNLRDRETEKPETKKPRHHESLKPGSQETKTPFLFNWGSPHHPSTPRPLHAGSPHPTPARGTPARGIKKGLQVGVFHSGVVELPSMFFPFCFLSFRNICLFAVAVL